MILCEWEAGWNHPDPNNPEIAMTECDVFAHNPAARARGQDGAYRLSIRRNLALGRWELYRRYHESESDVIEASGTLAEVCEAANRAWAEAWGHTLPPGAEVSHDAPCTHEGRGKSRWCPGAPEEKDPGVCCCPTESGLCGCREHRHPGEER
jgi:hypothetical protein